MTTKKQTQTQSLFKQRLMATGRVVNLDTKGRERQKGAADSDRTAGDDKVVMHRDYAKVRYC